MLQIHHNTLTVRKLTGLSQSAFGAAFGATKDMIFSYEHGIADPSPALVAEMSEFIGITPEDFVKKRLKVEDFNLKDVATRVKHRKTPAIQADSGVDRKTREDRIFDAIDRITTSHDRLTLTHDKIIDQHTEILQTTNKLAERLLEYQTNSGTHEEIAAVLFPVTELLIKVGLDAGTWKTYDEAVAELGKKLPGKVVDKKVGGR